jgi:YVTN family beta-propeller protein
MIVRTFGPYEIEGLLGRGGMGDVYRARDTRRERLVALKLLPEALSADTEYLARFRREQHVAARLREPHVIPIHDFGEIDGQLYIDMRLVDGRNVGELLQENGPFPPVRAVHLITQVAEALASAHTEGLVHRDVKPSNVLVTPRDFVYVVDFGIARSIGTTRTSLTMTGATVGTLDYMAPERFTALPIDGRADVYSLACLLHECLTGTRPFRGEDLASLMHAHLYSEPPRASRITGGVPPALDAVVSRGMAKRPEERFATTLDLAAAARGALQSTEPAYLGGAPTVRAPARLVPEEGDPPRQETAVRPITAAMPMPVRDWGVQSTDGSHRSVDSLAGQVPPPRERVAPSGPPSGPPATVSGPAPDRPSPPQPPSTRRRARRPWVPIAVAFLAVLVVVGLVYTFLLRDGGDGGGGDAAGSSTGQTSASPPPEVDIAASVPIPVAGALIDVGQSPGYIQVAPNGRYAYIANRDAGVVTVLDTTLDQVTATIPIEAGPPRFITFSPDGGRAYVTVYNDAKTINAVVFLDTATNDVLRTVEVGIRPFAPATTPDGKRLYVPSHDEGKLEIVDTTSGEIVGSVPTPPNPHWVVFSNDGRLYYTADHESGVVTAFDAATDQLVATVGVGKAPHSLAVSPDGARLSVVNYDSNTLSVIDTATNTVLQTVDVGLRPQDVTYAPDGAHLYTANVDDGTIDVVDTASGAVTARIPTGNSPTSISVTPDGRRGYVTNLDDGTVRILDLAAV